MKLLKADECERVARANGKSLIDASTPFGSLVDLALWRLRQSWGMLLVMGLGMLLSVMLVCAVPLYALVAMSAGVRQVFNANPEQKYMTVSAEANIPVMSSFLSNFIDPISGDLASRVGKVVTQPAQFSLQTSFSLSGANLPQPDVYNYTLACVSYDAQAAASHIKLLQGQLPRSNKNAVEILLTPQEASIMHAHVGSIFSAPLRYQFVGGYSENPRPLSQMLNFEVAGVFQVLSANDLFWHGQSFGIATALGAKETIIPTVLVANDGILNTFDTLNTLAEFNGQALVNPASVDWYYAINPAQLSVLNLQHTLKGLTAVQADIINSQFNPDNFLVGQIQSFVPTALIATYFERISAAIVSVVMLTLLMLGLILFFVNQMCGLLIERQSEVIALLRSRGASQRQVFGAFTLQGILLAALALVLGPFLAIALVHAMVAIIFVGNDQSAISLVSGNLLAVVWSVRWYALATVVVALGATVLALWQFARLDVLRMRREVARMQRRTLLQRLHWDIVLLVLATAIYGVSLYMLSTGLLDAQLSTLWLSPLTLLASACIVLAGAFLLLRLLPRLLNLLSRLAVRARGAAFLLAIAQIARAPQQTLRTMLLLLFTTAFATFTLMFFSAQALRIPSVATYQAGADFSGTIVAVPLTVPGMTPTQLLKQVTSEYGRIPGVLAAAPGYTTMDGASNGQAISVYAVDTASFAQSTYWTGSGVDASTVSSLMAQLLARRGQAASRHVLPAIVDAATWNALHLHVGAGFTLTDNNSNLSFVALAEVPHIPTISDSANGAKGGGLLVDYTSYAALYAHLTGGTLPPPNTVWLRTKQDAPSLKTVRTALSQGPLQLEPLYDRQALIKTLKADPLDLALIGILSVGAATPLLLALLSSILTSWFSTSARLTNFAVLRALGSTPRQVAQVMAWEQGSIYVLAIGCGIIAGVIFSLLVIPVLVFTGTAATGVGSTTSGNRFFILQSAPPIQVVFPSSLLLATLLLCAFCAIALALVVRLILRTSLSSVLRLNAD